MDTKPRTIARTPIASVLVAVLWGAAATEAAPWPTIVRAVFRKEEDAELHLAHYSRGFGVPRESSRTSGRFPPLPISSYQSALTTYCRLIRLRASHRIASVLLRLTGPQTGHVTFISFGRSG